MKPGGMKIGAMAGVGYGFVIPLAPGRGWTDPARKMSGLKKTPLGCGRTWLRCAVT